MNRRLWFVLLFGLAACTPAAGALGTSQTLRAGPIEIKLSAPASVRRQDFYPVKVTYTNKGKQKLTISNVINCSYLPVRETATGQVLEPAGQKNFGCTTEAIPPIVLAPGQSHSGISNGIIDRYPKGRYVISPQDMQGLRPSQQVGPDQWSWPEFTSQPQKIFFELR